MIFEIQKSSLLKELDCVSGIANHRASVMPALSHIAIDAFTTGTIRLTATDLNTSIITEAVADVKTPGSLCIPANKLLGIVKLASECVIKFSLLDNGWVQVKTDHSRFKIPCLAREHFPEPPSVKQTTSVALASKVLLRMIARTSFAMPVKESDRFNLNCLKFSTDGVSASMVATDGNRMAMTSELLAEESTLTFDVLIPHSAVSDIVKLASGHKDNIAIFKTDNHVFFRFGKHTLISTMTTGEYPNYELMIPKGKFDSVEIPTDKLIVAIRCAALVAKKLRFDFESNGLVGELKISAANPNEGEANESITLEDSELELAIAFNHQYMLDFLENVGVKSITMDFGGSEVQAVIRPSEDTDGCSYRYIIMPMRLISIGEEGV